MIMIKKFPDDAAQKIRKLRKLRASAIRAFESIRQWPTEAFSRDSSIVKLTSFNITSHLIIIGFKKSPRAMQFGDSKP